MFATRCLIVVRKNGNVINAPFEPRICETIKFISKTTQARINVLCPYTEIEQEARFYRHIYVIDEKPTNLYLKKFRLKYEIDGPDNVQIDYYHRENNWPIYAAAFTGIIFLMCL